MTLRTMSRYSRVRASGFSKDCPYQPSTTWGPDTPSPRTKRPPDRWSMVIAAMPMAVGLRRPDRVEAEPFGFRHQLRGVGGRARTPVAQLHSDLHVLHGFPPWCVISRP